MFLGHYALALGAKRSAPRTSLGVLVAAAQLLDLIWPLFLLLGWEHVEPGDRAFTALSFVDYPWSHSLVLAAGWSLVATLVYGLWRQGDRRDRRGALVVALLVFSHWVLDYVTHRPDLPLYPGGAARVGLGLWNSVPVTLVVEGALWIAGIALYLRSTRALDRTGRYAFWSLIAFLTLIYAASVLSPPPADMRAVAWASLALILVPFWAAWADRHRQADNR